MASLHRQTLVELVKANGWRRGAELGVDSGVLFGMLLRECPDLHLTGVDLFPDMERSHRVFEYEAGYSDRCEVLKMSTDEASLLFEDGHFDFVFIDADHSYQAVKSDIRHWASKVRSGGWLGGHDYRVDKFPGVVKAVDRAFGKSALKYAGTIWGVGR
jgi:predicted O-methyltransferase YrrM